MLKRIPWFERTFAFDFPVAHAGPILERLRGTPVRLAERVRDADPDDRTRSDGRGWSIQENVGHLFDLESLWRGRFDDFAAGVERLRDADLTNRRTNEAGHNQRTMAELLGAFRDARLATVEFLESLPGDKFAQTAIHPRLGTPMRVVDLMFFVAEHDDYHMARIGELVAYFRRG